MPTDWGTGIPCQVIIPLFFILRQAILIHFLFMHTLPFVVTIPEIWNISNLCVKNEGPLPKMLDSPADGTSVSLPLGCCKSVVLPLVEDLFINNANGPGRLSSPPAQVPSAGLFNIFGSGPLFLKFIWHHNKIMCQKLLLTCDLLQKWYFCWWCKRMCCCYDWETESAV